MARIFISHAASDKDLARRIAEGLKRRNTEVWFDEWELKPGDNLIKQIAEGINTADALLCIPPLCLDPGSVAVFGLNG